jgi:hypothetical protein
MKKLLSVLMLFAMLFAFASVKSNEANAGETKHRWKAGGTCWFPGETCIVYKYSDGTKIKVY